MSNSKTISNTIAFVKQQLQNAEGGHDWFHIERVWRSSSLIAKHETTANTLIVELAALLHDIADSKFHHGDETIGPITAQHFLESQNLDQETITHIVNIIKHISFKGGNFTTSFHSIEFDIVQDADRLDAIGAIGIARAFSYGGFKGRELFNPDIAPILNMTKKEYKSSTAPTINHFYEKLLLLKNGMNTKYGKELGQQRHDFLLSFLEQFYEEWYGNSINILPLSFQINTKK